ncbi:MAG TPA: phage major capsid protein [Thermoclostridium caenicola]|uniref:phage major capsid protein n=1 Tax=Thermoclostridium caenicola TaxID=659425 RepID=UPI002D173073|nr:phage major capsid protein [Thermoclostridium caenicola]HPO77625.1 phage major capsid protein [Thermoclostridium caenicola]
MKNLDVLQQKKAEIQNKMVEAIKNDDTQAFSEAFEEFTNILQEAVMAEAQGLVQAADNQILAGRGVRVLTSEERKYYERVIDAMKSNNPKQALSGFDDVLPKTVINEIFEDITENHPLLEAINFQNAEALVEYLYSTMDGRFKATWGKLCSSITEELSSTFHKLNFGQNKLSAFIPVCKAMLDLGPEWLDRYVRAILYEAIANGLEDGILNGRGETPNVGTSFYEPIGMIRDLTNYNVNNGYAAKATVPVSDFGPGSYGGLIAQLAVGANGLNRTVGEVLLVCNPVDYYTKIMPAIMFQQPDGTWVSRFPYPTRVVQSAYMTQGKAVLGIASRYLAVLGTGRDGRIEYSDEYKFLEDERTYLVKLYGTGRPLDNTSFLYLDISGLKPYHPVVRVADYVDARLGDIEIEDEKGNAVNIGFNENIHYYAASIGDVESAGDRNVLSLVVTPNDDNATIVVKAGSTTVSPSNGEYAITLTAGQNVIVITSSVEGKTEAYVLIVTYTPIIN